MKTQKVITYSNLPTRLPISLTLSAILGMDYWNAPQWAWGVFGCCAFIIWAACIFKIAIERETDVLEK